MLREYFIVFYGAVVIAFLLLREVIDMFASIEYAEGAFPRLAKLAESKKIHRLLLVATMIFYGGTLYEMLSQPPMPPICAQSAAKTEITAIVQENSELKDKLAILTKPEPSNSLRHRTIALVNDLNEFWAKRPPQPTQQQMPVQNPASDADRARNAEWDRYWRETTTAYQSNGFNDRILGIVREYAAKGVPTGYLERAAEQPERLIGALPYGGFSLTNCENYMTEMCLLRELAFHVDAYDNRIDATKF